MDLRTTNEPPPCAVFPQTCASEDQQRQRHTRRQGYRPEKVFEGAGLSSRFYTSHVSLIRERGSDFARNLVPDVN